MHTGICTTDFEKPGVPALTADALFKKIRRMGFEAVQFAFSSVAESDFTSDGVIEIPPEITDETIDAILAASEKYDLPIIATNGTFNMAHPDKAVREEGLARFDGFLEASAALGAEYISLCSGTRAKSGLWDYSPENAGEEAYRDSLETIRRASVMAEKYGLILAIESEAANVVSSPEIARRMLDDVGSPNLKMILDCANLFHAGHAHPEEVEETIRKAFDYYGHDIALAHGKDILPGEGIAFTGTGRGIVDFTLTAKLLREYDFKGDMFLHGIYDEEDMPRAKEYWEKAI